MTAKQNVYEMVTEQIITQLEAGTAPWRMPWRRGSGPANLVSGKDYRGINIFLLGATGYTSRWWLTMNQLKALGGRLRYAPGYEGHDSDWYDEDGVKHKSYETGQHSSLIVFWQMIPDKERRAAGEPNATRPFLRFSKVFNLDQTQDVRIPKGRKLTEEPVTDLDPIDAAEAIIAGYPNPPRLQYGEPQAWYRASDDLVNMPSRDLFNDPGEFYTTVFHEFGHSTGHKDRLARPEIGTSYFGSHPYGREELVAEMTAAFLAAEAGITHTQANSAAYLASWIKTIKADPKAVVVAAGKAQKAADHILDQTPDYGDEEDTGNNEARVLVDA